MCVCVCVCVCVCACACLWCGVAGVGLRKNNLSGPILFHNQKRTRLNVRSGPYFDPWCGVVWCGVVWCGVVWCNVYVYISPPDLVVASTLKSGKPSIFQFFSIFTH